MGLSYKEFLRAKVQLAQHHGFVIDPADINPLLKPHQRDTVQWIVKGGRRAVFAAFGLGKTIIQLEGARLILKHAGGRFLIVAPLGVRREFVNDAEKLGIPLKFIRSIEECEETGIYITNYETVRDGKLNPQQFTGASLDEAAILRGFGGTKTFREFMRLFEGVRFKFVATATPSPNDFIELLAYSAFLEIMDVGEAKTRWFKRDSTKADQLTIHSHKKSEFWMWCATWGLFLQKPSDLGHSDEGYDLPPLEIHWHELPTDHSLAGEESTGQGRLIKSAALGVTQASKEKRQSLTSRVDKVMEIVRDRPTQDQFIVWCDLNDEQKAIEKALAAAEVTYSSLTGSMPVEQREDLLEQWRGEVTDAFVSKPVMYGAGVNLQQCNHAIFSGIGFKFSEFVQAIKRIHRFLQTRTVRIDLIYTEAEREIRRILEQKWQQHDELMGEMSAIIRQYGLATAAISATMQRSIGVKRVEASGAGWGMVNNDCVLETRAMADASVHMVLTSVPFSTQYEYTPSFNDFGHSDSNEHFWQQMDYLTPELFRVLKPGRVAAIHVKDRIVPGGINKLGFQTIYPFHADAIQHFTAHGFAYMGMKTIVTDVVRENNQTYRLGWTEQCKDATKMGCGLPEYLLLFRRPPSDTANAYADEPAIKNKGEYSRSRWQIDAHAFTRSNGNRPVSVDDLNGLSHDQIFKLFRQYSLTNVYDFERHVELAEHLEKCTICGHIHIGNKSCGQCECKRSASRLPVTFMLLQPASWHDDVWSDVTRMLTLNGAQSAAGREMHLCPLPLDIADRSITQFTMPGEVVYDPFAGIGTVPYRALLLRRQGKGVELNPRYFADAVAYCRAAEQKVSMPTLFDLLDQEDSAA